LNVAVGLLTTILPAPGAVVPKKRAIARESAVANGHFHRLDAEFFSARARGELAAGLFARGNYRAQASATQ
jgi:hypothetical protein